MEEVHRFLSQIPGLAESFSMHKAMSFIRLAAQLKDEIVLAQAPDNDPVISPPHQILEHVFYWVH
jgi:hypothetical protein